MYLLLKKSDSPNKKYTIISQNWEVDFGARGYSDYTIHQDKERKQRYIQRHKKRENWNKSGMNTPGFWSRWLLWNKPSLIDSILDVQRRFGVKILV